MSRRDGLVLVYAGLGATAASIGPLLPPLTDRLGTTSATVSLATTFLFAGLVVGAALVAALRDVAPARVVVIGGVVQLAGVVAIAGAPSVPVLYAAAGLLGVGFGAVEVTASVIAGAAEDGARRLALLTAVFAGAAIATPAVVAVSVATTGGILPAGVVVAGLHGAAAIAVGRGRPTTPLATTTPASDTRPRTGTVRLTLLLVAYVGAEATLATWSGELGRTLLDLPVAAASLVPAAFWTCLLVGRLAAGTAMRRREPARVLATTLLLAATAGLGAALVAPTAGGLALALAGLAVVAMGPVYGVTLAFGARPSGGTPRSRTAWLVAVGAVGGAAIPALVAPASAAGPSAVLAVVGGFLVLAAALATRPRGARATT